MAKDIRGNTHISGVRFSSSAMYNLIVSCASSESLYLSPMVRMSRYYNAGFMVIVILVYYLPFVLDLLAVM